MSGSFAETKAPKLGASLSAGLRTSHRRSPGQRILAMGLGIYQLHPQLENPDPAATGKDLVAEPLPDQAAAEGVLPVALCEAVPS